MFSTFLGYAHLFSDTTFGYTSYAKGGWLNGLPAAGSHSGGTVDILLALDCLSGESLFGNRDVVIPAGLLISSFMNFGGYHSFNETFPIAQAYGFGERFDVDSKERSAKKLYSDFDRTARLYTPDLASDKVSTFKRAYRDSFAREKMELTVKDFSKIQIAQCQGGSWEIV